MHARGDGLQRARSSELGAAEMCARCVSINNTQRENTGHETSAVFLPPNVIGRRLGFVVYRSRRKAKKVRMMFYCTLVLPGQVAPSLG